MPRHKNCVGTFTQFQIKEHNFCFMQCNWCHAYLGGNNVEKEVNRLMQIKVRPRITRT